MPHLRGRAVGSSDEKNNNGDDESEQEPTQGKRRVGEVNESETVGSENGSGGKNIDQTGEEDKAETAGSRNGSGGKKPDQSDQRGRRVGKRSRREEPAEQEEPQDFEFEGGC